MRAKTFVKDPLLFFQGKPKQSYEKGNSYRRRQEIADRYRVSLGMVKKLLQQRKRAGDIGARHAYSGRKPSN